MDDPRRMAMSLAGSLREGTARAVLRAFVRGRDEEARRLLSRTGFVDLDAWLADPLFLEWLLEGLEYRIAPDVDESDSADTEPYELAPDEPTAG
jgi:hypothetical protein